MMSASPTPHRTLVIYVAGPLFSPAERRFNNELCAVLETICKVYLPQRDGRLMERVAGGCRKVNDTVARDIYEEDIVALRQCDVLVALLDGRALDEGVCIEVGYAKALDKVIVGYKSDVRVPLPWGQNPMLVGCIDYWVSSVSELAGRIRELGES